MEKQALEKKVDKNRDEIQRILQSDLPLELVYHNVRRLAKSNDRLLGKINA